MAHKSTIKLSYFKGDSFIPENYRKLKSIDDCIITSSINSELIISYHVNTMFT